MNNKTVLEKIISNCENAVLMHKPIILFDSDELSLVHRIVQSDRLIARIYQAGAANEYQLYRNAQRVRDDGLPPSLFSKNNIYKKYIHNVASYSSVEEFGTAVEDSCAVMYPGNKTGSSVMCNLEDYPCLYLVHGEEANAQDTKIIDTKKYKGLYKYVDYYMSCSRDDNSRMISNCLIIYGKNVQSSIPDNLKIYCAYVDEPLPKQEEIISLINTIMTANNLELLDQNGALELARSFSGFRLLEIERMMKYFIRYPETNKVSLLYDSKKIKRMIIDEKEQMLKKDSVLELKRTDNSDDKDDTDEIGGMNNFKEWLEKQRPSVVFAGKFMQETGGTPCKGVLMCGIPGCGKSLAAQTVATSMKLPLLKLEIGRLMGKYVGESENNLNKAIKQTEAMAPCVLWIDEIEKGFGGNSQNNEVSQRMFGTLLTWLQECRKPVFNFATANNIAKMPKEFFRSGRFDALFALYMPTYDEILDIVSVRMKKLNEKFMDYGNCRNQLFADFDMTKNAAKDIFDTLQCSQKENSEQSFRYMTGADVEKIMNMALRTLWNDRQYFTRSLKPQEALLSREEWIKHLSVALDDTKVYGDGSENLDSIAACYVLLLRGNFSSATKNPLFCADDYKCLEHSSEKGNKKWCVSVGDKGLDKSNPRNAYDEKFREIIAERMKSIGPEIEENQRNILSGR